MTKIAISSLDQAWLDKKRNLKFCKHHTALSSSEGCSIIIFPEMTLTGFAPEEDIAENIADSYTLKSFRNLALNQDINIIFGASLRQSNESLPSNMLCLARTSAVVEPIYSKIHPFSYSKENNYTNNGNNIEIQNISGLNIGFAICYDLRFPEIFSIMSKSCDIIVIIANWPSQRISHWRTLLTARAIENQCYFIGVNRVGIDGNGVEYENSSMVVSPSGSVLSPDFSAGLLEVYDVDAKIVKDYRKNFPTIQDKRSDLYIQLYKILLKQYNNIK